MKYNDIQTADILRDLMRKGARWQSKTTLDITNINVGNKNWGRIDYLRKHRGIQFTR